MGKINFEKFEKNLEKKVRDLEELSSIELVSVIREKSSSYVSIRCYVSLIMALAVSILLHLFPGWWSIRDVLLSTFGVFLLSYFVFSFEFFLKIIVPKKIQRAETLLRANESFLFEEVFNTKERTGVLVFVSVFEKDVLVLADKGLCSKINEKKWHDLGVALAKDFTDKNPGDTFLSAIDALIKEFSGEFPASVNNKNELSNHLRKF